ncbi:hypothetical protein PENSPDRAFT_602316 [Peniophora sp. CONT]|nr:hypothetical protein PENSPDRAFT_602316 [Peniophora sp. CONT]
MGYHADSDSSEDSSDWASFLALFSELAEAHPPYVAGTLPLPSTAFDLYYKDANGGSHVVNLVSASSEQLEALMLACEPASFGRGGEDVMDEDYRKAGKLDVSRFSTPIVPERTTLARIVSDFLLEGEESKTGVEMELYKLNIYGKDSFFKEHVDTPRSERMLGSLVIVFPTPHHGGELVLRPDSDDDYTFDSGNLLTPGEARIGYAAFFSDVAHEVLPVTDGYRITLTFNLYAVESNPRIATPITVSDQMAQCSSELSRLLEDDAMMPDGGRLVFGLRHSYPITDSTDIAGTWRWLKGVDRILWRMLKQMDLKPDMHLLYELDNDRYDARGLIREQADLTNLQDDQTGEDAVKRQGVVWTEGVSHNNIVWVTPMNQLSRMEHAYTYYGNQAGTEWAYAHLCFVARVGERA